MSFRWRRSPRIAMLLICGCALVSLYLFQHNTWRDCASRDWNTPQQFVARYGLVQALVPKTEAARFVLDECNVDAKIAHPEARLFFAQYALSPRCVGRDVASRWVIVDSDRPEIVPEIASRAHWTLVADFRNGVRLYRTDVRR